MSAECPASPLLCIHSAPINVCLKDGAPTRQPWAGQQPLRRPGLLMRHSHHHVLATRCCADLALAELCALGSVGGPCRNLSGFFEGDQGFSGVFRVLLRVFVARAQSWEDEDVSAALGALGEALAANIVLLSSWDKYKKEVLSGSLEWTPMHTSAGFWAEHAAKFEERDFQARMRAPCRVPGKP